MHARMRSGVFDHTVRAWMGSNSIVPERNIETSRPMDEERLYLLDIRGSDPLELVPFVRMLESPRTQENACYFYNRIERDEVRWVSYHFDQDAELVRPDRYLLEVIGELEQLA